jgi:hypothetical protein
MSLRDPVILLGAPAQVMAPFVAAYSRGTVVAPPGCQVASAVGAAASAISLVRKVDVISLPYFAGYRAFLPDSILDGMKLEEVVSQASQSMTAHMNELARLAGSGSECLVSIDRENREARLNDGTRMLMGTVLTFRVTEVANRGASAASAVSAA